MKKLISFLLLAALFCSLNSFYKRQTAYNNIFSQLGLETEEADSYIISNLIGGSTTFPRTKMMARLALNQREAAIQEIGKYLKAYTQTTQFAQEYAATRMELKPEKPSDPLYQTKEFMDAYKEDLKYWEAEYPASVNGLLQQKLKLFLALTSDIDYNAKLHRSGSKMVFSDPELEAKDEFWKACYRVGKPTVDAARSYAQQWLLELSR
jgi:hypothetical protein